MDDMGYAKECISKYTGLCKKKGNKPLSVVTYLINLLRMTTKQYQHASNPLKVFLLDIIKYTKAADKKKGNFSKYDPEKGCARIFFMPC